jgi:hypothetical protein
VAFDTISCLHEEGRPLCYCAAIPDADAGQAGWFQIDQPDRPVWVMDDRQFLSIDTVVPGGPEHSCLKLHVDHFPVRLPGRFASAVPAKEALKAERVTLAALELLKTEREVLVEYFVQTRLRPYLLFEGEGAATSTVSSGVDESLPLL